MKLHGKARTCPHSRLPWCQRVLVEGWSLAQAAVARTERSLFHGRVAGGPVGEAVGDEPLQRTLVPGVEEVRMGRVEAAGRQRQMLRRLDWVRDDQPQAWQLHRVRPRTGLVAAVRHVAAVVRRVEVAAVPAVREEDVQLEERLPIIHLHEMRPAALLLRAGVWSRPACPLERAATPERHGGALRRACMWIAGDDLQPRRKGMHRTARSQHEVRGSLRRLDGRPSA
jgi:hypothetical protein